MAPRQDHQGVSLHLSRLEGLIRSHLWAQILVAMALGIGTGLALSPAGGALLSPGAAGSAAAWLAVPGRIFLALIQMVVVPLVLTSIILGITSGGSAGFVRRVGSRIAPYFLATTAVAVGGGATLALLMGPGRFIPGSATAAAQVAAPAIEALPDQTLPDRIIALVPANPANAMVQLAMLELVVFAILVAVALSSITAERARPILDLCASLQEVSMKVISWAMRLAPVAVFGLLAQVAIQVGFDALLGLSAYVGTVLLGLLLLLAFYLLLVALLARRNPLQFARDIREVSPAGHESHGGQCVGRPDRLRGDLALAGARRALSGRAATAGDQSCGATLRTLISHLPSTRTSSSTPRPTAATRTGFSAPCPGNAVSQYECTVA